MSAEIPTVNHNVQFTIDVTSAVYSGVLPLQSFEFFSNAEKMEIDTILAGNVGFHFRNPRFSFNMNIYQVGNVKVGEIMQMFYQNVEFSIQLVKFTGGVWEIGNLAWDHAYLTSVRGTGMSPENIPIIAATAKALTMRYQGKTYGRRLDGVPA